MRNQAFLRKGLVCIFLLLISVQSAFALRFNFVYDPEPKYAQYWTKDLKDQVTEAGSFLAAYIADAHTVEIFVTIDDTTTAFATGAPNYSVSDYAVTNTTTKFIARKGKISLSLNSAKTASESSNVSLVIHELMHCLGVTNNINGFKQFIVGRTFTGPKTKAMNSNSDAPLASDLSHFAFNRANAPLGVGPRINEGGGNLFSCIDLAVLSDIGYDVPLVKNANAPFHVNLTLNSLYAGRMKPEFGGFLTLDGLGGNDVLIAGDKKMRMTGSAGNDTYYISAGTGHEVMGLEANDKIIIASSLGITQAQINNPELKFRETGMRFTGSNTAEYRLSIGTFSMSVWNSSMPSKTNITVGNLDGTASTPVTTPAPPPPVPAPNPNPTPAPATTAAAVPTAGRTFNGTSDVLTTNFTPSRTGITGITVEYWFKGTKIQSAFRLQNGDKFIVAGWRETDPVHFFSNEGANKLLDIKTKAGGSVQDNQWHHIAVTWSRGTKDGFKSYVDGELVHQLDASNAPIPDFVGKPADLGAFVNDAGLSSEYTNGQVARVRIWNTARTAAQILESRGRSADYPADANLLYQAAVPAASPATPAPPPPPAPVAAAVPTSGRAINTASNVVTLNPSVTTGLSGQSEITIEYWFKGTLLQSPVRFQEGNSFIVAGWGEATPVHLLSNEGFNTTLAIKTKANTSVEDNQWHHVAFTWSRGVSKGFKSYVDGELIEEKDAGANVLPPFSAISGTLGAWSVNGTNAELMNGELARVRIWRVARTAAQILESRARSTDYPSNATLLYQAAVPENTVPTPTATRSIPAPIAAAVPTSGRTFNGTTDAVPLSNSISAGVSNGSAITIEYWFKGTNLQSAVRLQGTIGDYIVAGWGSTPAHIISTDGALSGVSIKTASGGSVHDNTWHHVAMTWEKNKTDGFKSYVDGVLVDKRNSANVNLPNLTGVAPVLGAFIFNGARSEFTSGQVARVRIWKTARTETQILESRGHSGDYTNETNLLYQGEGN
ncbi:MAG: LamG domain-containing protein [Bacteroidetes bacterium]|nr:MAG: LamG domain-containing protein [Bacteroidota bacterium]